MIRHQQQVRVMSSVCLHRWVPVVTGEGNAKALVCPFHNWTYDTGGQLIGTPYMNQAAEFDSHSCSLPQIRSEIVHGMIFITFSDSVESIADRLRPINALLDKYQVADLHTAYTLDYDCPFNWKMAVETFMECCHHSAVHRTTLEDSFPGRLSYIGEDGPGWTLCHQPLRKNGAISEVLTPGLIPLSGFSEQDMRQIDLMLIYPACLIGLNPDRLSISTLLPEDRHTTRWHRLVLVSKASAAQPDFAATAAEMKNGSLGIIDEDLGINAAQKIGSRSRMARGAGDAYAEFLYAATEQADRQVIQAVTEVATQRGIPQAQVALAWFYSKPAVVAPVVGVTALQHLEDALSATELTLSREEIAMLEAPYIPHPIVEHS
ncbi:Carnitine monooxygenase oxygenase subunit [Sodalis praecaptivus]|nr:Carnitine monooxygenase oxygenase subunit [Sodalis praecaptivus]